MLRSYKLIDDVAVCNEVKCWEELYDEAEACLDQLVFSSSLINFVVSFLLQFTVLLDLLFGGLSYVWFVIGFCALLFANPEQFLSIDIMCCLD